MRFANLIFHKFHKCSGVVSFFTMCKWKSSSVKVWCAFCQPNLPSVLHARQCFDVSKWWKSSTFPVRGITRGNRDPTSAIPGAILSQKTQGVAPKSVFTGKFTSFRTATVPNCFMMGGPIKTADSVLVCSHVILEVQRIYLAMCVHSIEQSNSWWGLPQSQTM